MLEHESWNWSDGDISLDVGETKDWNDIRLSDLDGNDVIKSGVIAGTITVVLTPDANDAAQLDSSAGLEISPVAWPGESTIFRRQPMLRCNWQAQKTVLGVDPLGVNSSVPSSVKLFVTPATMAPVPCPVALSAM